MFRAVAAAALLAGTTTASGGWRRGTTITRWHHGRAVCHFFSRRSLHQGKLQIGIGNGTIGTIVKNESIQWISIAQIVINTIGGIGEDTVQCRQPIIGTQGLQDHGFWKRRGTTDYLMPRRSLVNHFSHF
jgi:hypothetical protein